MNILCWILLKEDISFEIIRCNCMGSYPVCQGLHGSYCGLVLEFGHWLVLGVREVQEGPVDPFLREFPVGLGDLRGKEDRNITAVTDTACHSIKMKRFPLKIITITNCGQCDEDKQWQIPEKSWIRQSVDWCNTLCVCVGMGVCMCVHLRVAASAAWGRRCMLCNYQEESV